MVTKISVKKSKNETFLLEKLKSALVLVAFLLLSGTYVFGKKQLSKTENEILEDEIQKIKSLSGHIGDKKKLQEIFDEMDNLYLINEAKIPTNRYNSYDIYKRRITLKPKNEIPKPKKNLRNSHSN